MGKELTANCPKEICAKIQELIPVVIITCGPTRVQLPLWLHRSLINSISWNSMSWAKVVSEHLQSELKTHGLTSQGGIVHFKKSR